MNHVTRRNDCRLCESTQLELVLPILPSAIGDAFVSEKQLSEKQDIYPLDTYLCLECGHLQNIDLVNPEILFRHYTYQTSASLGLVEHFHRYAADVIHFLSIPAHSLIVEIGSNDGSLLKAFQAYDMQVMGVDPASNIAALANATGIPTIAEFFTSTIASQIKKEHGSAKLICANNVFAHADDLTDLVKGIHHLLADDGVFVFEVSYILDMIDHLVFDTIYHEHVSHHALTPLETFFNRLGMSLFHVEKNPSKGGSIRGFAQRLTPSQRPQSMQLKNMMLIERKRDILSPSIYQQFFNTIQDRKQTTLNYLDKMIGQGKKIAAYGASTTTTTLLYHFELGNRINFIVDDNPIKHYLFSPGFHLPVLPSAELSIRKPDVVVILAWIYADTIMSKHSHFLNDGGIFLIPLPTMQIIEKR